MKTVALLSLLAIAVPPPPPAAPPAVPAIPAGATVLLTKTVDVSGTPYLIAVFSNYTAASFRLGGQGGVINLPDRAVVALPGASERDLFATAAAIWPPAGEDYTTIAPYAEIAGDPIQGISGGAHPVEITYTYLTPTAGTTAASIVVTVRGHRSRADPGALARQLQRHVDATQKLFPPR